MAKRKEAGTEVSILVSLSKSEVNDEEQHMELCITPTRRERLLLELCAYDSEAFAVRCWHGPHCAALAMHLASAYKGHWQDGDPLSTRKEDEESDEEVIDFLRQRRERREAQYTYVVETECMDDDDIIAEMMDTYEDYVQETLRKRLAEGDTALTQHLRNAELLRFAQAYSKPRENK